MSAPVPEPKQPLPILPAVLWVAFGLTQISSIVGTALGFPQLGLYVGGVMIAFMLGGGVVALGWLVLVAPEASASKDNSAAPAAKQAQQFTISDLLILTSVLALEVAAAAQSNILLFCLFITVFISVLALIWKRTLLRRALFIATVLIWVGTIVAVRWQRI